VPALEKFKSARTEVEHSVMISAKSHTNVSDIRQVFFQQS